MSSYSINPEVTSSFDGLIPDGEVVLWASHPSRKAVWSRATYLLLIGGGAVVVGIGLCGFASWHFVEYEQKLVFGVIFAIGLGLICSGLVEPIKFLRNANSICKAAYLITSQTVFTRWAGKESGIFAVRAPAMVMITRKARGRYSDIEIAVRRDDQTETSMSFFFGIENGEEIQHLLENVLLGQR